jgi:hypothetical protein
MALSPIEQASLTSIVETFALHIPCSQSRFHLHVPEQEPEDKTFELANALKRFFPSNFP